MGARDDMSISTPQMTADARRGLGSAHDDLQNGTVRDASSFWPSPPQSIEESGLIVPFVEDHLIRLLYFGQQMRGTDLAEASGLPYAALQPVRPLSGFWRPGGDPTIARCAWFSHETW